MKSNKRKSFLSSFRRIFETRLFSKNFTKKEILISLCFLSLLSLAIAFVSAPRNVHAGDTTCGYAVVPSQPTGLTASVISNSQINLSWTASTNVESYTVNVSPLAGIATISGTTATVTGLTSGTTYTFSVTANNCYGSSAASGTTSAKTKYLVTVTQAANGTISPSTTSVSSGGSQTFTITPNANYSVGSLIIDGGTQAAASSYTFSNVTANHTITATYSISVTTYNITTSAGSGGAISTSTTAAQGSNSAITITPSAGYDLSSITDNGSNVLLTDPSVVKNTTAALKYTYTISNVQGNHTVAVTFAAQPNVNITTSVGANGTLSPANPSIAFGQTQAFTVTPGNGYIANVSGCGGSLSGSTYTTGAITSACTVSATFTINPGPFAITLQPGTGGTITLATGSNPAPNNSQPTFNVTAPAGKMPRMSGTCGGTLTGSASPYTFTVNPVIKNCTIVDDFVVNNATFDGQIKNLPNTAFGNINWSQGYVGNLVQSTSITSNVTRYARGVAFDSKGNIYTSDGVQSLVLKYSPTGVFITQWNAPSNPNALAIDSSDNIYVAGQSSIQKFSTSGTLLTQWGSTGTGDSQFQNISGIAVDKSGNVYTIDYSTFRVQKFSSSGSFITKWGAWGYGDGQFISANGIAIDSQGNVYVGDNSSIRVQKFSSNGTFLSKWGTSGSGDGQFSNSITTVAVDSNDNVYVYDKGNARIQKFSSSGTYIAKWGIGSSLYPVYGIAFNSAGDMYVSDTSAPAIAVFSSGTSVKMRVRSGTTADGSGSSWHGWDDSCNVTNGQSIGGGVNPCVHDTDPYVQYEAIMSTDTGTNTPTLGSVTISTQALYPTDFLQSYLISSPFNSGNKYNALSNLNWSADTSKGAVKFQLRTSADGTTWGPWCGPINCSSTSNSQTSFASDFYITDTGNTINTAQKDNTNDQYFQYAVFLASSDGTGAPALQSVTTTYSYNTPPAISNVSAQQTDVGSVNVSYTLSETYDGQGNLAHGKSGNPIGVGLFYQPDSGVTAPALTNNATGIVTFNNPNNAPIPTQGTMLLDNNELISFDSNNGATGNQRNIIARGVVFTDKNGTTYPTSATAHNANTPAFFQATKAFDGSLLAQRIDTFAATGTTGTQAIINNTFNWNAKNDPNLNLNGKKLTNFAYKVVANDADSLGFNTIGVGNVSSATLDYSAPTIASITTSTAAGQYKAGATIPLTITFASGKNIVFDATGGRKITLTLNSGTCTIASTISASNTAACTYNVGSNDNTPLGQKLQVTSVSANDAIVDQFGNELTDFTIPVGQNIDQNNTKAIIIDTKAPQITNVSPAQDSATNKDITSSSSPISFTTTEQNAPLTNTSKIAFTRTGGSADAANHTCTLKGSALNEGTFANFQMIQGANNCNEAQTKLVDGATYTMAITANDQAGNQTIVSQTGITYDTTAPSQPTVSGPAFTNVIPTITWSQSTDSGSGLASYQLQRATSANGTYSNVGSAVTDPNTLSLQDSTLTTDGSTDGTYYYKVVATDKAGNNVTSAASGAVLVDTAAPTVAGKPGVSAYTNNTKPTIKWDKSIDNGSGVKQYDLYRQAASDQTHAWSHVATITDSASLANDSNQVSYSETSDLTEDSYYYQVTATDNSGNTNDASVQSDAMMIDTTAPAVNTPVAPNYTKNTKPQITWTQATDGASGVASYQLQRKLNNGSWLDVDTNIDRSATSYSEVSDLAEGTYYYQLFATDKAGNKSIVSASSNASIVDITAPQGTFSINNNQTNPKYTNSRNITLSSNITDTNGSGLATMSFSNDNSGWSTPESYSSSKDWTLPDGIDGAKMVYVKFIDNAGNEFDASDSIILDRQNPAVTFASDIQSIDPVQAQNVVIHVVESNPDTASFIFAQDADCASKDYSSAMAFISDASILIDKDHYAETKNGNYICAKVTDKSGNVSYKASANALNIDVTAPVLNFASDVVTGPVQSNDINIGSIEANPNTYKYGFTQNNCDAGISFDNSFTPGQTFAINDESHNGNYICAQAVDKAGNTAYLKSSKVLNIDVTKPIVSFTDDVQNNPVQSDDVKINVQEINPNNYGYIFSDDNNCEGKDYSSQTSFTSDQVITFNTEAHNSKYICTRAEDKAGNVTYLASAYKLNIDVTAPSISFADDVDQGPTQNDDINISSIETNPDAYKYGFTANTCDSSVSFENGFTPSQTFSINKDYVRETQNGNYICVQAIDQANNVTYKKSTNKLNIDIIAPKLQKIDSSTPDVTIDSAYGTGQSINVCAYYDEELQSGSTLAASMDLVANVNVTLNQLDSSKHVLCGNFTIDGPRKGYDTTPNHLNVRSLSNENVLDIASNVQKYSEIPDGQNLADTRSIIIDTGGPILQSFTTNQTNTDLNAGKQVIITANYSKPVVTGSSIKVRLNTVQGGSNEITLDQRNSNKLSGSYTIADGDNVDNLKVAEITYQNVHDAKGNSVLIQIGTFDSYNDQIDTYNNQPGQTDHIDHVVNIADGIRIDTQVPNNSSVVINDGASETKPNTVDLKLLTQDNFSDLAGMKIQVSNNGSTWCDANGNLNAKSDYTTEIASWNLTNETCGKQADADPITDNIAAKVFVKFIDGAGNENVANDDITYNGVPPRVVEVGASFDINTLYGPGMQIPVSLRYNKPLSTSQTSSASIYFNNNGYATLTKTSDDTMSGVYTVSVSTPKEDTNNLAILSLSQDVFDTAGNEQTGSVLPSKATNNLTSGIHVDTTAPVGQLNVDRSVGDGNMNITFSALDENGIQGMKAKLKVLDDQTVLCSFDGQPEIDVTNENMNVTVNNQDAAYAFSDNTDPKKVCVQLIDRAGNASSPTAIFASAVTPETPQNLAVTDNSNISAGFYGTFLTWKTPANNGEGTSGWKSYEILHCKVDKNASDCTPNDFSDAYRDQITDNADTNYISYNGLSADNKYCYRIRFRDKNGDKGDYSKFSQTQCVVPGTNIQISTAKIDVRNGDGDISIYDITKGGATLTFRTQDTQKDSTAFATIANVDVYSTYSNVDKDGNTIQNKENWLQNKVGTFTDSGIINIDGSGKVTITNPNPTAKHTIKITGLTSGKPYYLKITAVDPQDYSHVKNVIYDGDKGVNANLTFTTLGQLSKISNISDPPTVLSDKDVVIDFKTDQDANCYIEYGTNSVANPVAPTTVVTETPTDTTTTTPTVTPAPVVYNEVPVKETTGEFTTNHSLHIASLLPQTVYYYKITCTDGAKENPSIISSAENKFRTLDRQMTEADFAGRVDGIAPVISNISTPTITGEGATVTWNTNEAANSLVAYELDGTDYMLMAGDFAVNSDHTKYSTVHSVNIAGLLPASKYLFTVISTDASGNIGQASQSTFTTKLPSSLSSIKVVSTALGQATITWSTGAPATSDIEYGLTTAYGQSKKDNSMTKEHEIVLEGLTPGQTYHFQVRGEDDQKNIFASSDITFQPQAPPKIDGFKVDSITEHGAVVTFTTNVPTSTLVTYVNTDNPDDNGAQGKSDMISNHKIELKNLTSGATFSIKVKVNDENGNETEENFANFTTTKDTTPPVIDRVKTDSALTQNDKVQSIISWTTDEMATGQVVYKEGKNGEEKTFDVNTSPSFSHVGVITSFKPGTVYYFNVVSKDIAGNVTKSSDYALLTPKQSQNIIQVIIGNFTDIFGWAKFGN